MSCLRLHTPFSQCHRMFNCWTWRDRFADCPSAAFEGTRWSWFFRLWQICKACWATILPLLSLKKARTVQQKYLKKDDSERPAHQHTSHMLEVLVDGEEQLSFLTLRRCIDNDSSFSNWSNARSIISLPAASAATQSFQVTSECPTPSTWPSLAQGGGVCLLRRKNWH